MSILSNWGMWSSVADGEEADPVGNLPIAVTQTVAKDAPFDPSRDVELGVAYISYVVTAF